MPFDTLTYARTLEAAGVTTSASRSACSGAGRFSQYRAGHKGRSGAG